ncbi:hypothetical protein DCAR_0414959 [Daucus carota subsp. sativus]|uniref:Uncharacterized protein n=1 Tax=Daucus carota subsp. sativus TaxID=79200 RepID=A0A162A862_DAUCS|nr:hypothetical protein DCAR_0414959 [Daucus carota subsp. sativus]
MGEKTRKRREEKGKEERLKGKMKEILKVERWWEEMLIERKGENETPPRPPACGGVQ